MTQQYVTFTLDGDDTEYKLAYDFNAICDAEPLVGCNLGSAMMSGQMTAMQTRGLLYAFLKAGHPLVTLAEAGTLLSRDLPTVMRAFWTVVKEAIGDSADEQEPPVNEESQEN